MDYGLRTDCRQVCLDAVPGANLDQGNVGIACGHGLERENADLALPVDTANAGWSRGRAGNQSIALVAVYQSDGLAIAAEQATGVDIYQLQHLRVELEL